MAIDALAPRDFLGTGWGAPLGVDGRGGIGLISGERAIERSVLNILSTAKGERRMRPRFGCGIHDLVFAPNDATTAAQVSFAVREALIDWEPRIEVLDVQVAPDAAEGNKLMINLQYRVRSTNNVFNLVYPFYLQKSGA